MIFEVHRQVIISHHTKLITVKIEHEREHLHLRVVNNHLHCHAVDHIVGLILEKEPLAYSPECLFIHDNKRVARELHSSLERRNVKIHRSIDTRGGGYVGIYHTVDTMEHRHKGVERRYKIKELTDTESFDIHSERKGCIILGGCGVEGVEIDRAHIRTRTEP